MARFINFSGSSLPSKSMTSVQNKAEGKSQIMQDFGRRSCSRKQFERGNVFTLRSNPSFNMSSGGGLEKFPLLQLSSIYYMRRNFSHFVAKCEVIKGAAEPKRVRKCLNCKL